MRSLAREFDEEKSHSKMIASIAGSI